MANLSFNVVPQEPTLKDVFDFHKRDIMLSMNCHSIGRIEGFDPSNQTALASIKYKRTFQKFDSQTKTYKSQLGDYPLLIDCPVVVLGGGSCNLTFPISIGDECLVLFNDRDIDNWFQGGSPVELATGRLHSFSDGIILVGLRNSQRSISGYDMARAVLHNGTTRVGVGTDKVLIENSIATLFELLSDLVDAVKNISVTVPGAGLLDSFSGPVSGIATGTVSPGSQAALSAAAGAIGDLLE